MRVEIINSNNLPEEFVNAEIEQFEKESGRRVVKAEFIDNGDETCKETFWVQPVDFERIRRITGYLVGTTDRWNEAKLAELHDRVKHSC